jgi:hypothetical protein
MRTTNFQPSTQLFKGFTVFTRIQVAVLTISHNDCSFCIDEFLRIMNQNALRLYSKHRVMWPQKFHPQVFPRRSRPPVVKNKVGKKYMSATNSTREPQLTTMNVTSRNGHWTQQLMVKTCSWPNYWMWLYNMKKYRFSVLFWWTLFWTICASYCLHV